MSPDRPRPGAMMRRAVVLLAVAFVRSVRALGTPGSLARDALGALASWTTAAVAGGRAALGGDQTRAGVRYLSAVVFGRRTDVSAATLVIAPPLALGVAWLVGRSAGYRTVRKWVVGTWTGVDPHLAVFLAVAALIGLGAASAAVNSGLLPTGLLVAAPVFGVAVTRYGTGDPSLTAGPVVSLPDAVGVAAVLAIVAGVPLALAGFLVGAGARRVAVVLGGGPGPSSRPDEV